MASNKTKSDGKGHQFGGNWTTQKLQVLAAYLSSYTIALKEKPTPENPFRKAFIDAFAGTEDWYDDFYKVETIPTLFGSDQERVAKASMETKNIALRIANHLLKDLR